MSIRILAYNPLINMLNAKIKRSTSGSFGKYCTATIAFLNVGREHNDLIVVRRHARMPLIAILRCNSRGRGRISWGSSERGRAGPIIYDPGRCYENLPFYFFFYFLFSKNPRLCTLDPRHVTLDPRLCTLDPRPLMARKLTPLSY